jgi:hypothetical protein
MIYNIKNQLFNFNIIEIFDCILYNILKNAWKKFDTLKITSLRNMN